MKEQAYNKDKDQVQDSRNQCQSNLKNPKVEGFKDLASEEIVSLKILSQARKLVSRRPFMPFFEGELPVKYLGVPLISSGLLNRDCKILVEKAKNRIGDWKNKSLSFAGRLQLCKSVISSMHVFWASVLIIPKGIIYDIHQLIYGFLWCNGELKRGKVKIAWKDICLPKSEGGLGLRNLEVFNFALMTTHIWNIISSKESLWVRWIHTYKLRGRTIWDVPVKDEMSWGWRKLLQLRDIMRPFFSVTLGNGNSTSLRPQSWLLKAPDLGLITCPALVSLVAHLWQWRDRNGNISSFSVAKAWEAIRSRVMRHGLKTHDKMRQWDVGGDTDLNLLRCALYDNFPDSHTHLFFECTFSEKVWSYVRDLAVSRILLGEAAARAIEDA
ncbi:hypothetical protein Tco_0941565 [Tanacetum coccineum]|uniref:Reverse transcriptase zinc-binding domain-containing protein n=1 Tax=Tanacetum coccineum TaxID=301880 RepID=A0ABQ5DR78_9ASTR